MTKTTLHEGVQATLERLEEKDRGLRQFLKKAYGYAVFPSVGKAALVVGGSYGRGQVFERGKFIGFATLAQTTIGVQVGGETYSEVIAFESREALERFKKGKLAFAANASAVLVKAGAAATADYEKGVAAFAYAEGGMLLELSIGGQKFKFKPADDSDQRNQKESARRQPQGRRGEQGEQEAEDQQDEDRQQEGGDEAEDSGGSGGGVWQGVRGAASNVGDFVKQHPVMTTLIGAGLAAGVAMGVAAAVRKSGQRDEGGDQSDDEDWDEDSGPQAEDQADEDQGEEEDEGDEEEERSETRTSRGRARA